MWRNYLPCFLLINSVYRPESTERFVCELVFIVMVLQSDALCFIASS